jgi:hypothetical protein
MTPNLTVGYMAEQINRGRLDGLAARGSLADEAAVTRSRSTRPPQWPGMLGTALVRLCESINRAARPVHAPADPTALPAR